MASLSIGLKDTAWCAVRGARYYPLIPGNLATTWSIVAETPFRSRAIPRAAHSTPVLLLASFAALSAVVAAGWTTALDHAVTAAAVAGRTPLLSEVAVNVTALGSAPVVVMIVAVVATYCLLSGRPRFPLALAGTPLVFLLNDLMKLVVGNPRPAEPLVALPASYGFPSGHSAAASALFLTLALLAARGESRPGVRRLLVGAGLGIALLVAWSRVYLGVHFLSDVIGGLLLGAAGALAASRLTIRSEGRDGQTVA